MADEAQGAIGTPETCAETTEYDNRIDEEIEITPDEIDQKFARFERSYRARRIRELTLSPLAPIRKKRGPRTRIARKVQSGP
jgi:hypothetical protein